jgi:hypothetical protein
MELSVTKKVFSLIRAFFFMVVGASTAFLLVRLVFPTMASFVNIVVLFAVIMPVFLFLYGFAAFAAVRVVDRTTEPLLIGFVLFIFIDELLYLIHNGFDSLIYIDDIFQNFPFFITVAVMVPTVIFTRSQGRNERLAVVLHSGRYAVCRLAPDESFKGKLTAPPAGFFSSVRSSSELTVITEEHLFEQGLPLYGNLALVEIDDSREEGRSNFKLGRFTAFLKQGDINFLVVSTYKTSYLLFEKSLLDYVLTIFHKKGVEVSYA